MICTVTRHPKLIMRRGSSWGCFGRTERFSRVVALGKSLL